MDVKAEIKKQILGGLKQMTGHPNEEDTAKAKAYAKEVLG